MWLQLVISTDGGFYRHYLRVRRWFGVTDEPAKIGGLCKPCQTMLWGTILAAALSPFVLIGWAAVRGLERATGRGRARWMRRVIYNDGTPLDKMCTVKRFMRSPLLNGLVVGLLTLVFAAAAAAAAGALGLGAWHFSDVAAWLKVAGMQGGWYLFAALAHAGLLLCLLGEGLLWLWTWFAEWFPRHYHAVFYYTGAVSAGLAIAGGMAALCVKLAYDPTRDLWLQHKAAAKSRRERRIELKRDADWEKSLRWLCPCGRRNSRVITWCAECGEARPRCLVVRLWRRCGSRVVAGRMRVAGGFGIAWALLKGLAKGTCPLVEFLSPEELRERGRAR